MVSVNLGVTSLLSLANRYAEMAVLFEMIAKKKNRKDTWLKCQIHYVRRDWDFKMKIEEMCSIRSGTLCWKGLKRYVHCESLCCSSTTVLYIKDTMLSIEFNMWHLFPFHMFYPYSCSKKEINIYAKTKPINSFLSHTAGALQATFGLLVCCIMCERDLKKEGGS